MNAGQVTNADGGLPLVVELTPPPDPEAVFHALAARPHCLFLDSALRHETLGRYSFIAVDPFDYTELSVDEILLPPTDAPQVDVYAHLSHLIGRFSAEAVAGLPPFQGGVAGVWGYELGRGLERLPAAPFDEFKIPAAAVGCYDVVVAWDHHTQKAWIISQGFPETEPLARRERAGARLAQMQSWLAGGGDGPSRAASPNR
ncbi:MAG: hypothetical protein KDA41_17550, partial [Planctomycetales bacterium]|nr:hypothetical protein [Planctomycetales bacterium]